MAEPAGGAQARPASARSSSRAASRPDRFDVFSTSIHSVGACALPPVPPDSIMMAGIPRLIGKLASVLAAARLGRIWSAVIAACAVRTRTELLGVSPDG